MSGDKRDELKIHLIRHKKHNWLK